LTELCASVLNKAFKLTQAQQCNNWPNTLSLKFW